MDWLDKAATGFEKSQQEKTRYESLEEQFETKYPDLVKQLWGMFRNTFDEVQSKFKEGCGFDARGDKLQLVIGDVMISGETDKKNYMGGFYGSAKIYFEDLGSGRGRQSFNDILISDLEDPKWVYLKETDHLPVRTSLEQSDVEEMFKTALSRYLK